MILLEQQINQWNNGELRYITLLIGEFNIQMCQSPAPAGPRVPKAWVVLARKETDPLRRLCMKKKLLIFRKAQFYKINITSPLSHPILHQILVSYFRQYIFSPHLSPTFSFGTFPITGFFPRLSCTLAVLPQWTNIFTLTTTTTKKCSIDSRYSMSYLGDETIHGKGYRKTFDISENSTIFFFTRNHKNSVYND